MNLLRYFTALCDICRNSSHYPSSDFALGLSLLALLAFLALPALLPLRHARCRYHIHQYRRRLTRVHLLELIYELPGERVADTAGIGATRQ